MWRISPNTLQGFFQDMDALHRELDRAFEQAGLARWTRPFSRMAFLPGRGARVYPLVNLSEDGSALYVEALAPGVDSDTLEVSVQNNQLTLSGSKSAPNKDLKPECFHRNERAAGKFVRTVELPVEVDAEKVEAEYKKGLLLVKLPKAEKAKPRQIPVTAK